MTRSQLIRGAFRVITLKLGQANVPLLVTNHTYDSIGYVTTKEMSGGSGLKYSASSIVFLSKKKVKEQNNTEQTGVLIRTELVKSRLAREGGKVEVHLDFTNGLDKYHGLVDFACAAGIWKKSGSRIKVGESTPYSSQIYKDPLKYFTTDVLDQLDVFAQKVFKYGGGQSLEEEPDDEL
jgi:RecA/RadA recombinase